MEISKKEMALHSGDWCAMAGGCIFAICLSNQFYFHWKPIFKVPSIDYLWAIVTIYVYSSVPLAISNKTTAADLSMIIKMYGGSPLCLIAWKPEVATQVSVDMEAQE